MKFLFKFLLIFILFLYSDISYWLSIEDTLLDDTSSGLSNIQADWNWASWIILPIIKWFKTEIFSLVMVLSIWVFIFIGIRFASARWNPEEFKKAWMQLIYAIIWIFFIFMAWWLVRLVSSLSL